MPVNDSLKRSIKESLAGKFPGAEVANIANKVRILQTIMLGFCCPLDQWESCLTLEKILELIVVHETCVFAAEWVAV